MCETERTRERNRVPGAFGRGSSLAEWGSTGLTNEALERSEVKGDKEKLRKIELEKAKMERKERNGGSPQQSS